LDVNSYLAELYFENGTVEIDNIIINHDVTRMYAGLYAELRDGDELIMHDVLVFGPDEALCVRGFWLLAYNSNIEMWNVIATAEHPENPALLGWPALDTKTAKIEVDTSSSYALIENCTFSAHAYATNASDGIAGVNLDGHTNPDSIVVRNVLAFASLDVGTESQAFFRGAAPTLSYVTGYNCASNDDSASKFSTTNNPYINVPLTDIISLNQLSSQFFGIPISDTDLENGATPTIPENTQDLRGVARGGTGIGGNEPLPPRTGDSPFVTNFQVIPTIEGPQLLALWSLPNDTDTSQLKLLKKLLNYSESETDGTELISSPIGSAPNYYVDLNPTPERAWCYTAFVYHYCTEYWQAGVLVEIEQTIVPTTTTGFFYVSLTRGVTGATEPTWPTEVGDEVTDGDIVWQCFAVNPAWVSGRRSRGAGFTWDSEYVQRLPFRHVPPMYRYEDAKSTQRLLEATQDPDYYNVWRAIHEDGTVKRGEFERFLLLFGAALSRVKGAADFYPKLVDPDECLPQYLPQLAGILGWELNTTSPTAQQRQELLAAVPTYKTKGTVGGLEILLRAATDVENVFVDPMSQHILMSNRINRKSARGVEYVAYTEWTPAASVNRGDIVIPKPVSATGYYYQARVGGTTSAIEPTWPTVPGDDVTDGTVTWRCRQFGQPHLTADATAGGSSISVDDTSEFSVGQTVNIRDITTPEGEEIVIDTVPDSTTLTFVTTLDNSYTMGDQATVTPAYDWYDDETGFIWDIPQIEDFAGVDPSRIRVPGNIIDDSILYSFEFLRLWFILAPGEQVSFVELERVARIMEQFAPADTRYVTRIEEV
jgi:phage tail-like protein